MAERSAEALPGLVAAASAVGLQDHQRMLHDHANRVRDGYQLGRSALGGSEFKSSEETMSDEMGDIVITGDIHVTDPSKASSVIDSIRGQAPAPQPQPQPIPPSQPPYQPPQVTPPGPSPTGPSAAKKYGPLALSALLGAASAGGVAYYMQPSSQPQGGYSVEKFIPDEAELQPPRVYPVQPVTQPSV